MGASTLPYRNPSTPLHGRTFLGHPLGLYVLFLVEMWERFSYYGMRGLLVLYLHAQMTGSNPGRGWSKEAASNLYGWYTGMAYFLPVFGGLIADKLIGAHRSMIVGGLAIALGHIVLAASGIGTLEYSHLGMAIFVAGLVLITVGTGHFKPNVSVMVGSLYSPDDPRRDGAFTIFYMGINIGAFICAFVCGTLGEKVGWHWGFGAAAVGMLLGLAIYTASRPFLLKNVGDAPAGVRNYAPLFFVAALVIAAAFAGLYYVDVFGIVGRAFDRMTAAGIGHIAWIFAESLIAIGILAASVWFVVIQAPGDRGPTLCILLFIIINAIFWFAYEQAGTSLNLFAEEMTRRTIYHWSFASHGWKGWEMPATWFQSVNPLLIILLAPLFAGLWSALGRKNLNPGQPLKAAIALLLLGAGYIFMVCGSMGTSPAHRASMFWLFATYTLHTIGELCISPTGLSFLTRTAPAKYVSFLMGVWFLSNAIANKVGGQFAGQVENIASGKVTFFWSRWIHLGGQADFFLVFVITSIAAGIVMLGLTPFMNWLLAGKKQEPVMARS
ncbi:MAG TPA: peptide MFS transporter [Tepidisphaeraceae bacterium]|jgi:POT family proton-dependent oligopeptide transporter|nr:peptide MFS transporter [Tepidisphaeraceae bacterium]